MTLSERELRQLQAEFQGYIKNLRTFDELVAALDTLDKLSAANPMYPDYIPDSVLINSAGQFIGNGRNVFYLVMGAMQNGVFATGNLRRLEAEADMLAGSGLKPFLRKLSALAGDNLLAPRPGKTPVGRLVSALKVVAKGKRHPTKSWTQKTVDEHITKLRDKWPGGFDKLVSLCRRREDARRKARKIFGQRNLIAAMELSSPNFLTRSKEYQDIRRQLPYLGKTGRPKDMMKFIDHEKLDNVKECRRRLRDPLEVEANAILKANKRLP